MLRALSAASSFAIIRTSGPTARRASHSALTPGVRDLVDIYADSKKVERYLADAQIHQIVNDLHKVVAEHTDKADKEMAVCSIELLTSVFSSEEQRRKLYYAVQTYNNDRILKRVVVKEVFEIMPVFSVSDHLLKIPGINVMPNILIYTCRSSAENMIEELKTMQSYCVRRGSDFSGQSIDFSRHSIIIGSRSYDFEFRDIFRTSCSRSMDRPPSGVF